MRNIFLLYMPLGNVEAMAHYQDTIKQPVPFSRLAPHLSRLEVERLKRVFGDRSIAVWGSRDGPQNRSRFERMTEGDDLLIVEGSTIKFMGKVALKSVNPRLSRELWRNISTKDVEGWDLVYFIANPMEVDVPFRKFCHLFGYDPSLQLRGFTAVSSARLASFYRRYDDLYSILTRLGAGEEFFERPQLAVPAAIATSPNEPGIEDASSPAPLLSDHIRMQWKLASLGLKAGEKVWVPNADKARLQSAYNFSEFEPEFSAGIDLPKNYFSNIDVVWKEEYRIGAAFEVENSTAIYSGLLRFADLSIVAPNTTYPMFIVAPSARRNNVREQLMRPAFDRLALRDRVKFLPYESVDEIERFFSSSSAGMSVDIMQAKAETLT